MEGEGTEVDRPIRRFRLLRKRNSARNRANFLRQAIDEQVVPRSTPNHLQTLGDGGHPFTTETRAYLEDAAGRLERVTASFDRKLESIQLSDLPGPLARGIEHRDTSQKLRLEQQLSHLIQTSHWGEAGRPELIQNLSTRQLTQVETEALSFGLKFAIGGQGCNNQLDTSIKNYRGNRGTTDNGFVQGLSWALEAVAQDHEWALPRRHREALRDLGRDESIFISSADKGGGVVIMGSQQYTEKMGVLLSDAQVYERVPVGTSTTESKNFNQEARRILRRSERGKKMQWLLEESPRCPTMRGLPKTHKPNVPMRPITSGIGSAPHRLARVLAKPLSKRLGAISGCHLSNSGDFKQRLSQVDMAGKRMVSFDVTALFTNVPIGEALEAARVVVADMSEDDLPLEKEQFLDLIRLCVEFSVFEFEGAEYRQKHGMAMGSPLSAVLACMFMEVLESGPIEGILPPGTTWLRYVDDTWVAVPEGTNDSELLAALNAIHPTVKFTMEAEADGMIPFLDTKVHRRGNCLKFSVYRKPTNKDDFVHYYSAHPESVKTQCILGFMLRAYRICDAEFIEDEIEYIKQSFKKLCYPVSLIHRMRRKAVKIRQRSTQPSADEGGHKLRVVVPYSRCGERIAKRLGPSVQLVFQAGATIGREVKRRRPRVTRHDSVVYAIPCRVCDKVYYGETGRGLKVRRREHEMDLQRDNGNNAMVKHRRETDHSPKFDRATVVAKDLSLQQRKAIESAFIRISPCTNHVSGRYAWAYPVAQKLAASSRA